VVTATNSGSIPLSNVHVSEPQTLPASTICTSVAVGATCVLAGTYTLTAADVAPNASTTFTGSATSTEVPGPVSFTTDVGFSDPGPIDNFALVIVSGDGQGGAPGTTLPIPLKVRLLGAGNAPVVGQVISFLVGQGSGSLTASAVTTNALGEASTQLVLGTTPGPVLVYVVPENSDGPSVLFAENITGLAPASSLSIVSGDGQTLVANVASSPLVVALKDASNAPVVGATINWTTSAGTLLHATTVTDSSGESSNTVTTTQAGAVTVGASSALAASPVSFSLNAGLVELSNLTPEQQAVAATLDNACPALAELSSPTPGQADLLSQCQDIYASAGIDSDATVVALDSLLSKTAQAQTNAAAVAIDAQIHNIQSRLLALRGGNAAAQSNGLTFTGPGGVVSLTSLLGAFMDETAATPSPTDAGFSRWGFFASGNIGRGEARANSSSPGYDYDINGVTAGIDYRLRDDWLFGAALGYTSQDTDLDNDAGKVEFTGWSISGYSTYSFNEKWYVDGVITWGRNDLTLERAIRYTLPLPGGGSTSIDQLATGEPDADLFSTALTFGGDFHRQAWGFSPYGQLIYSRVEFDAYEERMRTGPGFGLGLAVDARRISALTGILGTRVSYTHSTDWGVVAPTASLEWNHEFRDDPSAATARFIYDPTQTPFSVSGQALDSDYLRLGLGMTLVFTHGRSGFFFWQHTLSREGQSQDDLSLGLRIEF
jgi:outer membrane autotransporter protein